jgi:TRAP-type transport system periplasmic protein
LTRSQKNTVKDAAVLLATAHNGFSQRQNILGVEELRNRGMDVYLPSREEKEAFRKIAQPPAMQFIVKKAGEDWVKKIFLAVEEAEGLLRFKK